MEDTMGINPYGELFQQITDLLASSSAGPHAALLGTREKTAELLKAWPAEIPLTVLDETAGKHILKRRLNEAGSELILYTEEFDSMVYEIFNDSTTLLVASILLDPFLSEIK